MRARSWSPLPATAGAAGAVLAALALAVSGCASRSGSSGDVLATSTCPHPLHRVLVAPTNSAGGPVAGDVTPSPSIDPAAQHPFTAAGTYRPDASPQAVWPVSVQVDDGNGVQLAQVERCQVVLLEPRLTAPAAAPPPGVLGQVPAGHRVLHTGAGAGSLWLVDQPTFITENDNGSGAQDYAGFNGWYALVEDPIAGVYRVQQRVAWSPLGATAPAATSSSGPAASMGTLELSVALAVAQAPQRSRAGRQDP